MLNNNFINKRPDLIQGQKVGVITNFFTEQILKRDFITKKMPLENAEEIIEDNFIEVVFIEDNLYEEDHEWFGFKLDDKVTYLEKFNVNIVLVNLTNKVDTSGYQDYFQINFSDEYKEITLDGNNFNAPLLLNENLFNPIRDKKKLDVVYFNIGELKRGELIRKYHVKQKPIREEVVTDNITRSMLKTLISKIKDARVLYIYFSENLDNRLIGYLEKVASLQNTIVVMDPLFKVQGKTLVNGYDMEVNLHYMMAFTIDGLYRDKIVIKNNRNTFLENTLIQYESLDKILKGDTGMKEIKISVITSTKRKWTISDYIERLNLQHNVTLESILLTHGFTLSEEDKMKFKEMANFNITFLSESTDTSFGNCLNKCIEEASFDYFTKIDDDDYYYENYLIDAWISKKYSNADIVGKYSQFVYLEGEDMTIQRFSSIQNRYSQYVAGATIFCDIEFIRKFMFSDLPKAVDSDLLRRVLAKDGILYCGNPYEFCIYRAGDKSEHTWQIPDVRLLKNALIHFYGSPHESLTV